MRLPRRALRLLRLDQIDPLDLSARFSERHPEFEEAVPVQRIDDGGRRTGDIRGARANMDCVGRPELRFYEGERWLATRRDYHSKLGEVSIEHVWKHCTDALHKFLR